MKELFSNEIQRLELSWIQRIWHHRYNEVKNHPKVNVSKRIDPLSSIAIQSVLVEPLSTINLIYFNVK